MALVRLCGEVRSAANYSARSVLHAQERKGEDHDPEQEHAQVDALPYTYPRRREIGGDPAPACGQRFTKVGRTKNSSGP